MSNITDTVATVGTRGRKAVTLVEAIDSAPVDTVTAVSELLTDIADTVGLTVFEVACAVIASPVAITRVHESESVATAIAESQRAGKIASALAQIESAKARLADAGMDKAAIEALDLSAFLA